MLRLTVALALFWTCILHAVAARQLLQQLSDSPEVDSLDFSTTALYTRTPTMDYGKKIPCQDDDFRCVRKAVEQMQKQFRPLKDACSHNAIFSLLYLRVTETFYEGLKVNCSSKHDSQDSQNRPVASNQQNSNCPWVNAKFMAFYDVYFANLFLSAQSNYLKGRLDLVPEPWLIQFTAADAKNVTGGGNLLIGVNAHVNHDLPFAVEHVLRNYPDMNLDGNPSLDERKTDHNTVNKLLEDVNLPASNELATRFDCTMKPSTPEPGAPTLLIDWREDAWKKGIALATAQTSQERDMVVLDIKTYSSTLARAFLAQLSYDGTGGPGDAGRTLRDAQCASNKNIECYPTCVPQCPYTPK